MPASRLRDCLQSSKSAAGKNQECGMRTIILICRYYHLININQNIVRSNMYVLLKSHTDSGLINTGERHRFGREKKDTSEEENGKGRGIEFSFSPCNLSV